MNIFKNIAIMLKNWWKDFTMDPDERYISQARNMVELENRMREVIYRTNHNNLNGAH